jgi:hypothetical protein
MEITKYPDSDAVYVRLRDTQYGGGRILDDHKHLDLDLEGDPLGILFLYVSDGVDEEDIPGIPPSETEAVYKLLADQGIRVKSPA